MRVQWRRFASRRRKLLITLAAIAVVLIAARIALPFALQRYVNHKLDQIPEYDGRVGDIDVYLLRGAYQIEDVQLVKTAGKVDVPFFAADEVDLSVQWGALLDGEFVGEISLNSAKLNFVEGPTEAQTQKSVSDAWLPAVDDLFPLRFNKLDISDGEIHYRDYHSDPPVDVFIDSVFVAATNLTNSKDVSDTLFAAVEGRGYAMRHAPVELKMELNPMAEEKTFDLNVSLRKLKLTEINNIIRAKANFDFEAGTLDLDTELAAANGRVEGYVKPIFHDVKIVDWDENKDNPLKAVWEAVVGAVGELLTNQGEEQIATTIPIAGSTDQPGTDIFSTVGGLLQNAFFEALRPGIEGTVDLEKQDSDEKNEAQKEARKEVEKKQEEEN
ncbi:MAG TPA: DUF748 domain-containing protein [Candidatus Krumholzibacteria bacterium]|nr:DUF748 domain-containing protein [Candidatus Krumholzibacteria bacterium]